MIPHGRRWHALLALLLLLSGLPQGLFVVCVGGDGHVAIEFAGSPPRAASSSAVFEGAPCGCGDDCGPCHDSEIGMASLLARLISGRGKAVASPLTLPATVVAPMLQQAAGAALALASHPGRSPSSWPDLQRSVVLRI